MVSLRPAVHNRSLLVSVSRNRCGSDSIDLPEARFRASLHPVSDTVATLGKWPEPKHGTLCDQDTLVRKMGREAQRLDGSNDERVEIASVKSLADRPP